MKKEIEMKLPGTINFYDGWKNKNIQLKYKSHSVNRYLTRVYLYVDEIDESNEYELTTWEVRNKQYDMREFST